jgi:Phosphoenolpyruvate phosphomutase
MRRALQALEDDEWAVADGVKVSVLQADATRMTKKLKRKVDAVITSPPYHGAVDYYRRHQLETFWLDFTSSQEHRLALLDHYSGRLRVPTRDPLLKRAENFFRGHADLADTIIRLQAYERVGADVLYAPGLRNTDEIGAVCAPTSRLVNVLARPDLSIGEIVDAGAQCVSIGGRLTWVAINAFAHAATAIRDHGDFSALDVSFELEQVARFLRTRRGVALLAGRGVRVHVILPGPVDTDMTRGLEIPKSSPKSVARAILAGVEKGEDEIFPDPMSESMAEGWRSGVAKALERENAALVQAEPFAA